MAKQSKQQNGPHWDGPEWPDHSLWSITKIKPYPTNPRTHPPEQIALLATHLKRWGPDQPIVVDENGVILKGHGRRLAAIEAGLTHFPVIQRHGLPDSEKLGLRIADNQVGLMSAWEPTLMNFELTNLAVENFEMPLLGFSTKKLEFMMATPEDFTPEEATAGLDTKKAPHVCPKCGFEYS
jgi:ParB-like nuclease domain